MPAWDLAHRWLSLSKFITQRSRSREERGVGVGWRQILLIRAGGRRHPVARRKGLSSYNGSADSLTRMGKARGWVLGAKVCLE